MLGVERQSSILKLLHEKLFLNLSELVNVLQVSEATVRRDLTFLEAKGKLIRVHGGAKVVESNILEDPMEEKKERHLFEKQKIGKIASECIHGGEKIFLDAGTTIESLISYLTEKEGIQVVTNGYSHINLLLEKGIVTYVISGKIKKKTQAIVGARAALSLKDFYFDIAFLGANGFSEEGYYTPDEEEAIVKQTVIRKSKKTYILADSSKNKNSIGILFAQKADVELITQKEGGKK